MMQGLPAASRAMVLEAPNTPLVERDIPIREPGENEILIKVEACAVCRTDLHIVFGELPLPRLPLIPGHEVVGRVVAAGPSADRFRAGDRVGLPWLGRTCGACSYCKGGRENLCDAAMFTGYHLDGGFAGHVTAHQDYAFPIPGPYEPAHAAPFLCAGLIGHRAYKRVLEARRIGIYGFGAAAHIVTQIAAGHGKEVFAFTRPGDREGWRFAERMGAVWAGGSDQPPPTPLDAAIIFAPAGELVVKALKDIRKGGRVVCAGIYMSDIPSFPYELLWGERELCSIANLTRQDGEEFFAEAAALGITTEIHTFPLKEANRAIDMVKNGKLKGPAVLIP